MHAVEVWVQTGRDLNGYSAINNWQEGQGRSPRTGQWSPTHGDNVGKGPPPPSAAHSRPVCRWL